MSTRAWVLFLCFSSMAASAASAVTPVPAPSPDPGSRVAQARVAWDAENQVCRLLWLSAP